MYNILAGKLKFIVRTINKPLKNPWQSIIAYFVYISFF